MKPVKTITDSFRRLQFYATYRIVQPSILEKDKLTYWRVTILTSILLAALVFCTFAIGAAFFLVIKENVWKLAIFDVFGYLICIGLLFLPGFSYEIRAAITLLMLYLVGLVVILSVGPLSGGPLWLFTFAVFAGVLLGSRAAIVAVILNGLTVTIIGWLISSGRFGQSFPFFNSSQAMIAAVVNFIVLNVLVSISLSVLVKGLVSSHQKEKVLTKDLEQEHIRLVEAKKRLELEVEERKEAEEAVRESEQKYRLLADNVNDMIWMMDIFKQRLTYISPSVIKIRGYSPEEVMEQSLDEILTPESYKKAIQVLSDELAVDNESDPDRSVILELEHYRKDGTTIWAEVMASIIRNDKLQPISILGVTRDITERKQAEKDRVQLEALLRQSQKMESLGILAGGIAHEINNILGIIIGNTELALDDVPELNPAKNFLKEILTASLRAKDVVLQIMSFARKSPATRETVMIGTIVKEGLKLISVTIPKNIEIRKEILCDTEVVLANPSEVNQILVNLCNNSFDAMEGETGILEVKLETILLNNPLEIEYHKLKAGRFSRLTVKDNGKGINPEIIDRIFDPYFTTKDVDEGLGMGLAVVYGIVKKHDGAIRVQSEPGKGTAVEILFPISDVQPKIETKEEGDLSKGNESILFVDDEASLVKTAKKMLERQGYKVAGKTSSKEALKLFQKEPDKFDLIITDMAMPEMPGDRLAREILNINSRIPIILCTGHSERIDEEKVKQIGITAYIMKPLAKKELINTVRRVLDSTEVTEKQ